MSLYIILIGLGSLILYLTHTLISPHPLINGEESLRMKDEEKRKFWLARLLSIIGLNAIIYSVFMLLLNFS